MFTQTGSLLLLMSYYLGDEPRIEQRFIVPGGIYEMKVVDSFPVPKLQIEIQEKLEFHSGKSDKSFQRTLRKITKEGTRIYTLDFSGNPWLINPPPSWIYIGFLWNCDSITVTHRYAVDSPHLSPLSSPEPAWQWSLGGGAIILGSPDDHRKALNLLNSR